MFAKYSILLVASAALSVFSPQFATAQFGGLFGGGPEIETIETDALATMLQERQAAVEKAEKAGTKIPAPEFVVVDVRSDAEVDVSVIPGAITKAQFEKNHKKYADLVVIPYCTVGGRSTAYATQLVKDGWKVKNYKGSILQWITDELPLVTLEGKPTNRVHISSARYRVPAKYERVTR